MAATYLDGISQMNTNLPSARNISNLVFGRELVNPSNVLARSDILSFWGQFLAHDILLSKSGGTEFSNIEVPKGDAWFDPANTGSNPQRFLRFSRSKFDSNSGTSPSNPRNALNFHSSFVDASGVYGLDDSRASQLRTFVGGKLKTSGKLNGFDMLPYNLDRIENANDARVVSDEQLFIAGDLRTNENPALASYHTIFLREHNRLCDELAQKNPTWNDEKLYQEARKRVGAYIQSISFNEYVPITIGGPLPIYKGYNSSINPSIRTAFVFCFRYGHSEINSFIARVDENRNEIMERHILLRDGFFNPSWSVIGPDSILRGAASQRQQQVDTVYINDLRNFLFGKTFESGAMDLVAINIQRARDFGAPTLNQVRRFYNMPPHTTFASITSDTYLQQALATVYDNDIEKVELYVGGLAEDHIGNANVGPTFAAVIKEQYIALRDGDRFYYKSPDAGFTAEEITAIDNTRFTDIILRNSNITSMQCNSFYVSTNLDCSKNPSQTIPSNSMNLLNGDLKVSWSVDSSKTVITFSVESTFTNKWIGIGLSKQAKLSMTQSDIFVATLATDNTIRVMDYNIDSDRSGQCNSGLCLDTILGGSNDITNVKGGIDGGKLKFSFSRKVVTGDALDVAITNTNMVLLYAVGNSANLGYHGGNKGSQIVNFFSGGSSNTIVTSTNLSQFHIIITIILILFNLCLGTFATYATGIQTSAVGNALFHFKLIQYVPSYPSNRFIAKLYDMAASVIEYFQLTVGECWIIANYLLLCAVWFVYGYLDAYYLDKSVPWARAFAKVNIINLSLVMVPASRYNILQLFFGISFERANKFHKMIGYFNLLIVTVHGILMTIEYRLQIFAWIVDAPIWNLAGFISWICFSFMALFTVNLFRRITFEFFLMSHYLFGIPAIAFALLHTKGVDLAPCIAFSVVLFVIDILLRLVIGVLIPTQIVGLEYNEASQVTTITMEKSGLVFKPTPGQFIYLWVSVVLPWEHHPFTISTMEKTTDQNRIQFTCHIKNEGHLKWTGQLASLAQKVSMKQLDLIDIHVRTEGPYGKLMIDPLQYHTIVLISGGIGITPMLNMLQYYNQVMEKQESKLKKIVFVWSVKSEAMLQQFLPEFPKNSNIQYSIHCTARKNKSNKNQFELRENLLEQGQTPVDLQEPIIQESIPIQSSRAEIEYLLGTIREELMDRGEMFGGVYLCGPAPLLISCQRECVMQNKKGFTFQLHQETFSM